jgi:hypothetical protein
VRRPTALGQTFQSTALRAAAAAGQLEAAQLLLDGGADLAAAHGSAPLAIAAGRGQVE